MSIVMTTVSWASRQKGTWVEVVYLALMVLAALVIGAETTDNLYAEF